MGLAPRPLGGLSVLSSVAPGRPDGRAIGAVTERLRRTSEPGITVRLLPPFRVIRPDMSVDVWGVNPDAAWESDKGGNLRVIEFDPLPDGLSHARTAKVYGVDDWLDVRDGLTDK